MQTLVEQMSFAECLMELDELTTTRDVYESTSPEYPSWTGCAQGKGRVKKRRARAHLMGNSREQVTRALLAAMRALEEG